MKNINDIATAIKLKALFGKQIQGLYHNVSQNVGVFSLQRPEYITRYIFFFFWYCLNSGYDVYTQWK